MDPPTASRVVLSYPSGLSDWGRDQIGTDRYRGYFRRVLDEVRVGDVREEFVDVGCCGDSLDVPFRVERIDLGDDGPGGDAEANDAEVDVAAVDEATEIVYVTREGDVAGGWLVQSAAGPES